jgi:hypothetical protein
MGGENQKLIEALQKKDEETQQWRELVEECQKRINKHRVAGKENKKIKRQLKDKNKEVIQMKQHI